VITFVDDVIKLQQGSIRRWTRAKNYLENWKTPAGRPLQNVRPRSIPMTILTTTQYL